MSSAASSTSSSAVAAYSTAKASTLGLLQSKSSSKDKLSSKTIKVGESSKPLDKSRSNDKTSYTSNASYNSASNRVRLEDNSSSKTKVTSKESSGNVKKVSNTSDSSFKTLPGASSKAKSSTLNVGQRGKPLKTDQELKAQWFRLTKDPKLALNVVNIVKVPKKEYAAAENSRNLKKNRILEKKRFRRIRIRDSDNSESESDEPHSKSHRNISDKKKEHQKNPLILHAPSPMVQIPVDALPKQKTSDKSNIQEADQATASEVENSTFPKKRSNFVCEKFLDFPLPSLNYSQSHDSGESELAEVNTRNPSSSNASINYDSDDSCIWIRDSDEEGQFISVVDKIFYSFNFDC